MQNEQNGNSPCPLIGLCRVDIGSVTADTPIDIHSHVIIGWSAFRLGEKVPYLRVEEERGEERRGKGGRRRRRRRSEKEDTL